MFYNTQRRTLLTRKILISLFITERCRKADPPLWLPKDVGPLDNVSKEKTSVWLPTQETISDSGRDNYQLGVGLEGKVLPQKRHCSGSGKREREYQSDYQDKVPLQWEFQRPDAKSISAKTQCLMSKGLLLL